MTTPIQGLRGTGVFGTDFRPTNYRELYTMLEPNGTAPLNALLAMTESASVDDPKYNHFRDELPERRMTINNVGGYNTSATALQMTTGDQVGYVVAGSVIVNARSGEVCRVTAVNTTTLVVDVTRQIGSTTLTINQGDQFFVAGFAATEAANSPTGLTWDPTVDFNYTQIFRQAVEISNTLRATYLRTGDKESEMVKKALTMHMSDIERAMFFGRRAEVNGSTNQPLRFTGGLSNFITNVTDVGTFASPGVMSEETFDRLLIENIFAWGSKQKICFAGARIASLMQRIGKNAWKPTTVDGAYGITFTRYVTFAGELFLYVHPQFRQIPLMSQTMFCLDLPYIKYRYLEGRDTALLRDRHAPDFDGVKHEFLTECGLEFLQGRPHSIIKGWASLS